MYYQAGYPPPDYTIGVAQLVNMGSDCMATCEDIPTLTEWGLIIFGVVLVGFITYVFLKRRKVIGVRGW